MEIQNFRIMGNSMKVDADCELPKANAEECCGDPRSPTKNVMRTPLKVENSIQQGIDPRSPSCCINRTPIQISKSEDKREVSGVRMVLNYEKPSGH